MFLLRKFEFLVDISAAGTDGPKNRPGQMAHACERVQSNPMITCHCNIITEAEIHTLFDRLKQGLDEAVGVLG